MKRFLRRSPFLILPLLFPTLAQAHPGHDLTWDFSGGFLHPVTGFDHLLAMMAVGLWAAQLGGRARWLVPSAFVATMIGGAALGRTGMVMPGIEQGIAASVLVLGLLVSNAVRLPVAAGMALVSVFAFFHGFAHGAEMPTTAGGFAYGAGFIVATAGLHAAGVGLGLLAGRVSARAAKLAGWGIAAAGAALLVQA